MHTHELAAWHEDHSFGQDAQMPGESKTKWVIGITLTMMVVEIVAGKMFASMALLADGLHMASHAVALTITLIAYIYARKYARDHSYSFGTGKVNALGGFTGAMLLGLFALFMVWESVERMLNPEAISFNQAILVAVVGLAVNALCAFILGGDHTHGHSHEGHSCCSASEDHNLKAAYLHVIADALTSVLAIAALIAGKYLGWTILDPVMGIVGAMLVSHWSLGLLISTSDVLLDRQATEDVLNQVRSSIECEEDDVVDLHVWSIGPGIFAAEIVIVSDKPKPVVHYKSLLPSGLSLAHATVEVHERQVLALSG